jgi:ribosomal protein L3
MAKVWSITGTSKGFGGSGRMQHWGAATREECEPLSLRAHGQTQLTIEEN